ncbi:MAG TPA: hypothetical protein DC024_13305 [Clostridiales bacterium]|jgi:hypothetical protein|nr:hypothetical protein [Clostridiales bacterium]
MKKYYGTILWMLVITLLVISTASALKYYTSTTYVEHITKLFYYVGNVSVRGLDLIKEDGYWHWPQSSEITYKIPNHPDIFAQVVAGGPGDNVVRRDSISVPRRDNTRVYWNINLIRIYTKPGDEPWGEKPGLE